MYVYRQELGQVARDQMTQETQDSFMSSQDKRTALTAGIEGVQAQNLSPMNHAVQSMRVLQDFKDETKTNYDNQEQYPYQVEPDQNLLASQESDMDTDEENRKNLQERLSSNQHQIRPRKGLILIQIFIHERQ